MARVFAVLYIALIVLTQGVWANTALCDVFERRAASPDSEKKWRLAYFEAQENVDYRGILVATAAALESIGLIENGKIPAELLQAGDVSDARPIWDWLVWNAGGNRIVFLKDGFYSAHEASEHNKTTAIQLFQRVRHKNDVDLLLTFGTRAGIDVIGANIDIPVFILASTDPISAGIVASVNDSGHDNIHAQVNIQHYKQQLLVFYELFRFKKLGIAYDDTFEGRAMVALSTIEDVAQSLGVELVRCTPPLESTQKIANLMQCMEEFSTTVDAVYMTTNLAFQPSDLPALMEPLIAMSVPTFAQGGIQEAKHGALMSFAQDNFFFDGLRAARAIKAVMHGTLPRHIAQEANISLDLVINLRTAQDMYWDIPFEVLLAADVLLHREGVFE